MKGGYGTKVVDQTTVDRELLRDNSQNSRQRIYAYFTAEPGHTRNEKADFLKKDYGIGGHTQINKSEYWVDHDSKGLHFRRVATRDKTTISWVRVADSVDRLIAEGVYMKEADK